MFWISSTRSMVYTTNGTVAQLFESQVLRAIRGYRGNLLAVTKAIDADWIPKGDEPGLNEHLHALRDYLTATGVAEDDVFLLRYALAVPGMQCGVVPPILVLNPNRGGFSDRRKREAAGQVSRLGEVLVLARLFLTALSTESSQAIRELAAIVDSPRTTPHYSLLDQVRSLSLEEANELASVGLRCLKHASTTVRELGKDLLHSLACFRFEPLGAEICRSLCEDGIFWPASLYRDAGDAVTRELIGLLDKDADSVTVNHLVLCVAWTRSSEAVASFCGWTQNPPRWSSLLNVDLADYPPFANWSLDAEGERIDLTISRCRRMLPAAATTLGSIACRAPSELSCPYCAAPASILFDFENVPAVLPNNAPVKILCCLSCSMFAPTFVRYSHDGSFDWLGSETTTPRSFDCPFEIRYVTLESEDCPPFASANVFELDDASAIGGVPMWLQEADYPRCPRCSQRMVFLAQHDNTAIKEEGLHYAFFCPTCRISAVGYQQT